MLPWARWLLASSPPSPETASPPQSHRPDPSANSSTRTSGTHREEQPTLGRSGLGSLASLRATTQASRAFEHLEQSSRRHRARASIMCSTLIAAGGHPEGMRPPAADGTNPSLKVVTSTALASSVAVPASQAVRVPGPSRRWQRFTAQRLERDGKSVGADESKIERCRHPPKVFQRFGCV